MRSANTALTRQTVPTAGQRKETDALCPRQPPARGLRVRQGGLGVREHRRRVPPRRRRPTGGSSSALRHRVRGRPRHRQKRFPPATARPLRASSKTRILSRRRRMPTRSPARCTARKPRPLRNIRRRIVELSGKETALRRLYLLQGDGRKRRAHAGQRHGAGGVRGADGEGLPRFLLAHHAGRQIGARNTSRTSSRR